MTWDMMAPMLWMGLLGLLALLLIIVGIVLVIRSVTGGSKSRQANPPQDQNTAIGILKERYARGEIDENEYQERRRVLDAEDSDTTKA